MSVFYPEIEPYLSHRLRVDEIHELYLEESGNPQGLPVLFLHGGPGAGCESYHRRFFNPEHYRIILFDQRGCGRSTPHACLEQNTSWHLVADMERIRQFLGIDQWLLFGGSWGSTLALAYAESHPQQVSGLILRGVFLARHADIQWFYQQGTSRMFPDYWQDFIAPVAEADRGDMVRAYYRLLTSDDETVRLRAARAWSTWEGLTATLVPNPQVVAHFSDPESALSIARIECHYFINNSFFDENQLINNVDKIRHIPAYIVQGRYDVICPMEQAWALHQAWPEAAFHVMPASGHSVKEDEITRALIKITDQIGEQDRS
ncbi:MAG: prolyl aminopeptidase [Gammaproteobacteria bacterium]|nr:prolyl aminopeptidase [Gammaproteobacteria bacterium]